ncbi:MAG: hypothetical protein AB1632_03655 [Nitrospirota bacterium]
MKKTHPILAVIFIASLSSLSYEITIVRIFSISLWYHFAFMVISIAMLGIGASGTLLSVSPGLRNEQYIPFYALILGISIPVSYLLINIIPLEPARLSWDSVQIFYVSLYYILLAFPFFSFGMIIVTAFSTRKEHAGYIYGADLAGAGIGSILTLWLLSIGPPENIVFIISSVSMLSPVIIGKKRIKFLSFMLLAVNLAVLYLHPSFIIQRISPYKPLEMALRFPGAELIHTFHSPFSRVDIFKSPAVRFAPGLSFRYLEDLPEQTGMAIDAGDIYAVTDASHKDKLDFINYLPSSLPYELSRKNNILLLEPKGGLSVLTAEYYRGKNIYKVDSNPLVIKSINEYHGTFPADIYKKQTWSGLGRSWLMSNKKGFDLIDISLMGSMPSGIFGFSEDYRFTVEAFRRYLDSLDAEGFLSVDLFILPPPKTELRLVNTIAAAFEELGLKDFGNNIAAIRSWGTITLLVKKSVLSPEEIKIIKEFAKDKKFDLIYYPGITKEETNIHIRMPSYEYFDAFKSLINPETRQQFVHDYIFDIRPVYDENPFFHYYLKSRNIKDIYKLTGGKWQYFMEEGYLLPVIFIQVLSLSALLLFLPAIKFRRGNYPESLPRAVISLFYFAFLGIGFMFVEISFIQKMILPLENPSYAMAAVLSSMLISSGIGSILSQRSKLLKDNKVILLLAFIIFLYSLFMQSLMNLTHFHSLKIKIIAVFFLLMPAGIFMGIPFPTGLSVISSTNPELIPWAWAVNGCFSVLAPILAVMFALSAGFKMVIIAGVLMYLLAFFSLRKVRRGITFDRC